MVNSEDAKLTASDYNALDSIPPGVGVYDVTGDRIEMHYINDGYYQMIGVKREDRDEYLGDRVIRAVHPDDRRKMIDEIHASVVENRPFKQCLRIMDGTGSYVWIEVRANHKPLSAGTERFFASYHSVEEYVSRQALLEAQHNDLSSIRSALEEEKRRNDTLMEKILSTTQTAIFWKDAERRFMGVNRAFLDYYGFTDESALIGKTDEDMGWHSDPDPFKNDELQVITTGESTYRVHGKCMAHGEDRDIVASKSPLYIDGKIAGLVGSFEDVTTERRQREEIEKLNSQLKQKLDVEERLKNKAQAANDAKTEFLSRVSHDMRTPLNVILGMSRIATEQTDPGTMRDCLAKIDTSAKFLLGLINDVLDLAKAERGFIELRQELYPHDEFMRYIDTVIKPMFVEKGVELVTETQLADGYVAKMDKLHSNQVIFNILSNAAKFTPKGGTVTLRQLEHLTKDGKIDMTVIVSDTGIGMSKEFQKTLFQPFTQEIRNDTSITRGTGLGLSIAKELADLMHSTIKVESRLNHGTTVTLHGVFDCVSIADFDTLEAQHPRKDHARLAGTRMLLCEDHPLNQEIVRALLANQKVLLDMADDGQRGVEMFQESPVGYYRVILMDIRMPVMDGYMATAAIRRSGRPDAKTVPIIAMSADVLADDVQKCLDAGMNGHIAKPLEPETMYSVLEECVK